MIGESASSTVAIQAPPLRVIVTVGGVLFTITQLESALAVAGASGLAGASVAVRRKRYIPSASACVSMPIAVASRWSRTFHHVGLPACCTSTVKRSGSPFGSPAFHDRL
ncbi:MAG: hypothetical protein B7Z61_06405 [Acidobacteria bacterium 37-71-11]|nr:MAG: hypothetical protein B7Z61_06405 [Acidobacteria bacterium 37-71-11]